jgi:hypothetical protein
MPARPWHWLLRILWIDGGLPRAVRRPMVWLWVSFGIVPVAPGAMVAGLKLGLIPGTLAFGFVGLMFVANAFGVVCLIVARRALRRAAAHEYLLCPDCTYDLRTLDATGTCPECGRAYEHAAVRATWLDAQRRLTRR